MLLNENLLQVNSVFAHVNNHLNTYQKSNL